MNCVKKYIALCICLIFLVVTLLPSSAWSITPKEEDELSKEFMRLVFKHYKVIEDPFINSYINRLGQSMLANLPPQPFQYKFYVIDEEVYNAFAAPSGKIFFNSGLIAAMDSEDELAGIMAHELAHGICRHISQRIERSKKVTLATLAGVVAGAFLGIGGAGSIAQAVTVGSMAAGQTAHLAYSREDEMQADQLGLNYLEQSGYSAEGLLVVLKKIRDKRWYGPNEVPDYLSTHPAVEDRIAYIDTWIANRSKTAANGGISTPSKSSSQDFLRVRTRLAALYGDEKVALNTFADAVESTPSDPMAHYGYALALKRNGDRSNATLHLKKALEMRAFDAYLHQALGQVYFLDGQYSKALKALQIATNAGEYDPEGAFYMARTLMHLGRKAEAIQTFEALVARHPNYTDAYFHLGKAYGREEKLADAHYNLGIYYHKRSQLRKAVLQLKKALDLCKDAGKKEKIESLLDEIRKTARKKKQQAESQPSLTQRRQLRHPPLHHRGWHDHDHALPGTVRNHRHDH